MKKALLVLLLTSLAALCGCNEEQGALLSQAGSPVAAAAAAA